MKYGFCNLAAIPVRSDANNTSEQITQLLFGETFQINDEKNGKCLIRSFEDDYCGWISDKQFLSVSAEDLSSFKREKSLLTKHLLSFIEQTDTRNGQKTLIPLSFGTKIIDETFSVGHFTFHIDGGDIVQAQDIAFAADISQKMLNVPYLWGGRNTFGIDCSGFSQLCYRFAGIGLPRDAHQQANQGLAVRNLSDAVRGDLCFFSHIASGAITHVGIYLGKGKIIHSSVKVRIDFITEEGIIACDTGNLTHFLSSVRTFQR
ncbi:MAG: C40 family peptidase [Bacteroidales bacterium]|jgi:hypothetical protein|nr:C40 family peptidase [Bacteroidales bacterium]